MIVLSLFDGMSCGQQALERINCKVDKYFASEIDKHAIKVTMANYPNTIQLGDVRSIDVSKLPKIDLLLGGSPCQSFSFAGKRKGMSTKDNIEILTLEHYLELKSQNFEFEGQSYLFWEYMRILNDIKQINPNALFLLENVEMGEKWEKILSKAIGVNGIHINSSLVSAQNRKRIYWTNIGMKPSGLFGDLESIIQQPKDKGIILKDILEPEVDQKYYLSEVAVNGILKHKAEQKEKGFGFGAVIKKENEKMNALKVGGKGVDDLVQIVVHNTMPRSSKTGKGGTGPLSRNDGKTYCLDTGQTNVVQIVAMRGRNPDNPSDRTTGAPTEQRLEPRTDNKTNCLTTVQKDNLVLTKQNDNDDVKGGDYRKDEGFRWRDNNKSPTLMARARQDKSGTSLAKIGSSIRRLTPIECERLQTVKDNYTNHVSDTQRYRMLGNGWTIDVIAHILSYMETV
jgi:DNA (cytosine-5)-methyltransferase 3A